jgi:hypothetical protein
VGRDFHASSLLADDTFEPMCDLVDWETVELGEQRNTHVTNSLVVQDFRDSNFVRTILGNNDITGNGHPLPEFAHYFRERDGPFRLRTLIAQSDVEFHRSSPWRLPCVTQEPILTSNLPAGIGGVPALFPR